MTNSLKKYTYPFFESIRLINGEPQLLSRHQERINKVFKYYYPHQTPHALHVLHAQHVRFEYPLAKWRIAYHATGIQQEIIPYQKKIINKFIPVEGRISYSFKYSDRAELEAFNDGLEKDQEALIVTDGRLRECTYGNIVLRLSDTWFTPRYPIFYGIMRSYLLDANKILQTDLFLEDFHSCAEVRLINALNPLEF